MVMEWSLLNADPTGITPFFVDEGIDTGPQVVDRRAVSVSGRGNVSDAKAYLFSLDTEVFGAALAAHLEHRQALDDLDRHVRRIGPISTSAHTAQKPCRILAVQCDSHVRWQQHLHRHETPHARLLIHGLQRLQRDALAFAEATSADTPQRTEVGTTAQGLKPFVMTNLKTNSGLNDVVSFIETKGMLKTA